MLSMLLKWICTLIKNKKNTKNKRSQPDQKALERLEKHIKYLWSAIILFQCLMFPHEVFIPVPVHTGGIWVPSGLCEPASAAHLGHIREECDTTTRLLTYQLLELKSDWVSCHWKTLLPIVIITFELRQRSPSLICIYLLLIMIFCLVTNPSSLSTTQKPPLRMISSHISRWDIH